MASLGRGEGGPPRVTPSRGGVTRKKVWGDTLEAGDTRMKAIKSDSDSDSEEQKKVVSFWEEEIRGDIRRNGDYKKGRQVFQKK